MRKYLLSLVIVFSSVLSYAQGVYARQEGKTVVVEYDLEHDAYRVELFVSTDGGRNYQGPLYFVSGDTGEVVAGKNKMIRWDVMKEFGGLKGDAVFKVKKYLKKYWNKNVFVTANASYSSLYSMAYGLSFGMVKHWGWYVSAVSNMNFQNIKADYLCDENHFVDGIYPLYTGEKSMKRHSVTVGAMLKLAEPLCLKLGAGYGISELYYQTADDKWVKNEALSVNGIELSAGMLFNIKGFALSLDVLSTNFKTLEGKIGIGWSFTREKLK